VASNLDVVAGHEKAKELLRAAAKAIKGGHRDVVPMGYLVSGPIGTGKTFMTTCFAGEIGIPERRFFKLGLRTKRLRHPAAGKRHLRSAAHDQADLLHPAGIQAGVGHVAGRKDGVREIAGLEMDALHAALGGNEVGHRRPAGPHAGKGALGQPRVVERGA
jgi:hypothetical protein